MAATELFKAGLRSPTVVAAIETKYETLAESLGIVDLDVDITSANDIAVVTTSLSLEANSAVPLKFHTAENLVTETHVYAPFTAAAGGN